MDVDYIQVRHQNTDFQLKYEINTAVWLWSLENNDITWSHSSFHKPKSRENLQIKVIRQNEETKTCGKQQTGTSWSITNENEIDLDRIHIKKSMKLYHTTNSTGKYTKTMDERQAETSVNNRSGAADECGRSHMRQDGERSTRSYPMEETDWWPLQEWQQYKSSK